MGKLKQEVDQYEDMIRDRIHELAQDKWFCVESMIEDIKEELRDEIIEEMAEWYPSSVFPEVSAEDIIEVLDNELIEDMIDDAIYSEWDV